MLDTNFRSSTGYGDAFKWATWGAWGTKDGQDVISGIDYVIAHYPIDRARVATMGHSYGGFMTNWLITQYPDRFAAAASGAGISNWFSDYGTADIYRTKEMEFFGAPWQEEGIKRMILQSPLMQAGHVRTPTLFINGEMDQRVPYEEAEQMYFALRRQGVPAKMIAVCGPAARHQRPLEQRPPHAERAEVDRYLREEGAHDVSRSRRLAARIRCDLAKVQQVVPGVETAEVSGALFAALGVHADALQILWRGALDQAAGCRAATPRNVLQRFAVDRHRHSAAGRPTDPGRSR